VRDSEAFTEFDASLIVATKSRKWFVSL